MDENCIPATDYTYNDYYQRQEPDFTYVSDCGSYYKCPKDNSEGCRTISVECVSELCQKITYFDDFIGEDKYWKAYGSYYNATYWEYYDGQTNETTYDNETWTCDEDCEALEVIG